MRCCPRCHALLTDDPPWCDCGKERPTRGWTDDPLIGRTVGGRYRVERRLGVGGMGIVYRAVTRGGEAVAIKTLRGRLGQEEELARRFRREARAAALLSGPNTVRVMESGALPDGTLYYVMELVEGVALSTRLARGPLAVGEAVHLLRQLLDALEEAHGYGLVHRDLKPENLLIGRGAAGPQLKVLDFGIVKILDASVGTVDATGSGRVFGTPEYMSPEQARGDPAIDHRSDIYAAGVLVFAMLAGRLPFEGRSSHEAMMNRLVQDAPPLSSFVDVSPKLEAVVARMLARDVDARFQSVDEVRAALPDIGPEPTAPILEIEPVDALAPTPAPLPPVVLEPTTVVQPRAAPRSLGSWALTGVAFVAAMLLVAWLAAR